MKVFVLRRNSLFMYLLIFAAAFGIYRIGRTYGRSSTSVSANIKKQIPIYCVDTNEKKIALTFDAAWDDADTDEILSALSKNNVKISIFAVGGWVDRYPETVKKFYDAGHEILNHSDSHAHMNTMSEDEIVNDINVCEEKIKKITGDSKKLFRAPYGEYNDAVINAAVKNGYQVIQWDCDSLDWKGISADEMEKRIFSKLKNGSIILMHNGAKNTANALLTILPDIKAKGYEFVKVSDLIYKEGYKIDNSGKQVKTN